MSKKMLGFLLIAAGDIVLIVSLAADALGLGNGLGLGWKQAAGGLVGLVVQIAGVWLSHQK